MTGNESRCSESGPRGIGIAIDIGGTTIKSSVVDNRTNTVLAPVRYRPTRDNEDRRVILDALCAAVRETTNDSTAFCWNPEFVAVAVPGPFDYGRGASLMDHKFVAIRGESLIPYIRNAVTGDGNLRIGFFHDLHAFLWGEHLVGNVQGAVDIIAVSIGTGLGCAYMRNGMLQVSAGLGPCLQLYRRPIPDGVLEDVVSHRGIVNAYGSGVDGRPVDVKGIAERARSGDRNACDTFIRMGKVLGDLLSQVAVERQLQHIVFGGQISRAFDLFGEEVGARVYRTKPAVTVSVSRNPDASALIGASALLSAGNAATMEVAC